MNIFVINLKRDVEKKKHIIKEFEKNNLKFEFFEAIDGKSLKEFPIDLNWYDPWYHYHITMGEVGCALSHISLWKKMIKENIQKAIIFEDDIHILHKDMMDIINQIPKGYDWVYLGRKIIGNKNDKKIHKLSDGSKIFNLLTPSFSYWTCGYVLTFEGAKKLCKDNFIEYNIKTIQTMPLIGR